MRLYHFIDQRYGIDNIEKRRLKVSRIKDLNDPFELLSMDLSENGHKEEFEALKIKISEDLGILCFSQCWRNPVQWGHYADKHKGLCLAFEMEQENAFEVEYIEKRYDKEFTKKLLEGDFDSGSLEINNWIKSKYNHWIYEQEYRYIIRLKDRILDRHGFIYHEFSEKMKLVEIIIGAESNTDASHQKIKNALGNNLKDVQIFKANLSLTSFEIERNIL